MSEDEDSKVGYGKPPHNGRFKSGKSGNPKGRPTRPKVDRSVTIRQIRRDILGITERIVPVNTPDGFQRMPTFKAILLVMLQKAIKGHGPSQRFLIDLHINAIQEHERAHPDEFSLLEQFEKAFFKDRNAESGWAADNVKHMRKATQRV